MQRHTVAECARQFRWRVGARDAVDGEQPFGGIEEREVTVDELEFPLPPILLQRLADQSGCLH